jgi:hypothetical protein
VIYIGTERLHSGVFWKNEFDQPRVAEDVFIDIYGGIVVQRTPISGGRIIELEAKGSESGGRSYFTRRQIELFEQLEISRQMVVFIYGNKVMNVTVPASSMAVTPVRDMHGHIETDIYYGILKLLEA